jgi:hypothetical protein
MVCIDNSFLPSEWELPGSPIFFWDINDALLSIEITTLKELAFPRRKKG